MDFVDNLQGLGDILVFETKKRWNKEVKSGIERLEKIANEFFTLKKNNFSRFEKILYDEEFLELRQKNKREAELRVLFYPDGYLTGFYAIINPLIKIHSAAMNVENDDISRFAVYRIIYLLAELSSEGDNDLFVDQILRQLSKISQDAVKARDQSMYSSSIHWYADIVFNKLRKKNFNITYLEKFNKYFLSSVTSIISRDDIVMFTSVISSLIDGIMLPISGKNKIWDYENLLLDKPKIHIKLNQELNINKDIEKLINYVDGINTFEKLNEWKENFYKFKEKIFNELDSKQKNKAHQLEKDILDYADAMFKYNNLLEVVYSIGAFCWSKKMGNYIRVIWEYKQPSDADAHWVGHNIIYTNTDELIKFYFGRNFIFDSLSFSEGHHGSEKYFKEYFLLSLAKNLESIPMDIGGGYSKINDFVLPDLDIYQLSSIEYSISELVQISVILKQDMTILGNMGFNTATIEETFTNKLIPFLEGLKFKSQQRILDLQVKNELSTKKVNEFENEVLSSFNKNAVIRNVLKHFKLLKTQNKKSKAKRFGVNKIDEKAIFFDQWNITYADWGRNYADDLAGGEDNFLLNGIKIKCRKGKIEDIEGLLNSITKLTDLFIFSSVEAFFKFFHNETRYKSKWESKKRALDLPGFMGWYEYKNKSIPVFEIRNFDQENYFLILNRKKFGRLLQFNPLEKGEPITKNKNGWFIDIDSFSSNTKLLEEMLNTPPKWLKEVGNRDMQSKYLLTKVRIRIFEKFELGFNKNFEGYLINL